MNTTPLDWPAIRSRAAMFPEEAFDFVREGLKHTARTVHGDNAEPAADEPDERRHITGRQLCLGLREVAQQRYGLLARTVLNRWGVRCTGDFGMLVYAMIDRGELRAGDRDHLDDFKDVFEFAEAFQTPSVN